MVSGTGAREPEHQKTDNGQQDEDEQRHPLAHRLQRAHAGRLASRARAGRHDLMAIGVLAGLLANILFELLWWLGPVVALPISAVAARAGISGCQGCGCD